MKVDVAVQSFRKPESLLYTLMTLKAVAEDWVDTVYINDDCSNDGTAELYKHPAVIEYFKPWKLDVRVNSRNVHVSQVYVPDTRPDYMNWWFVLTKFKRFIDKKTTHNREDIRYQYAIDHTDKKYLFVIHDDVKFFKNIIELYAAQMEKNPNLAIVGDLGQCWRCKFAGKCSPKMLMSGQRPSPFWPLTPKTDGDFDPRRGYSRDCRINEWCCLLDVEKCKAVTKKYGCFIGNYYRYSDIGAFWFCEAVKAGYDFCDPLPSECLETQTSRCPEREPYYWHAWQGHSGHSVWVDQGQGIAQYNKDEIISLMKQEYDFDFPEKGEKK